jgi:gas vesicle protein GvpA/GvpJ/GvpM family
MTIETTTRTSPEISLVDLLDRLLGTGVVLVGDVVISLAGIDLVRVQLEALITSVRSELEEDRRQGAQSDET